MVIFGRCSIILDLICIIIIASVSKSYSSSCRDHLDGTHYYDSERKQCLPCRTCTSPLVVIATCRIYSNTRCGHPALIGGSLFEVLQETSSESSKNIKTKHERKKVNIATELPPHTQTEENSSIVFKQENCQEKQNTTLAMIRKLCKSSTSSTRLPSSLKEDTQVVAGSRESQSLKNSSLIPNLKSGTNGSEENVTDDTSRNFFFSYFGKVIVSSIVISINLLLIIVLISLIIKRCYQREPKDTGSSYPYNQRLPHPSRQPLKCRFTAVLPSKMTDYANVDSYFNSLISPTFSSKSNSSNWNNSCASTMPSYTPQVSSATSRSLSHPPVSSQMDTVDRDPLITPASEVVENANMIQLYSRIPTPNSFTMNRLLEHRRAVGSTSVENNLYVETWCSSTSPMLSRSQESSIAPSPALSSIRKPLSSSNSSSPLTTRTFRATPLFSSFHPNRL